MLIYEARVLQGEEIVGAEALGWKCTWCVGGWLHVGSGVNREEVGGDEVMQR